MTRIDRLDPHYKIYLSCALLTLGAAALAWWLLSQLGHAQTLAQGGVRAGSRTAAGLRAHYSHVVLIGWLGVAMVAVGAALLGHWLSQEMTRPLQTARAMALRVAGGDLSGQLDAGDSGSCSGGQMMRALQDMNDKLAATVTTLRAGAQDVANGAGALATAQVRLAAQAERELGALRQSGGALQGLAQACGRQEELAAHAAALAGSAHASAHREAAGAAELESVLASARHGAAQIGPVTGLLEDIAFQANMLAMHAAVEAAVEAAPGGQAHLAHGAGLAHIARELRTLAQDTAEAARRLHAAHARLGPAVESGWAMSARIKGALQALAADTAQLSKSASDLRGVGGHGVAMGGFAEVLSGLERTAQETKRMLEGAETAALRDRARAMLRMLSVFRLTRRDDGAIARMYLVASNPDLIVRPARDRRGRARIAAVKS